MTVEKLTQEDIEFILWCLGYIVGSSDKLDNKHKEYIKENHDRVLSKIGRIYEELNGRINN